MSPSSRNVGRPANASFQRGAFGLADRHHLFCMRACQLAPASQAATLSNRCEIFSHFILTLHDHCSQRCIISRLRSDHQPSKFSAWAPKSGVALPLHPRKAISGQLRAAALARARSLHAARKAFISPLSTSIRLATPLYFFVIPMTVRLTAPW